VQRELICRKLQCLVVVLITVLVLLTKAKENCGPNQHKYVMSGWGMFYTPLPFNDLSIMINWLCEEEPLCLKGKLLFCHLLHAGA